jgi:hypothetical protein
MPKATHTHTTPTRRTALGATIAVIAAGLAARSALASTEPDDADAKLIRLCADGASPPSSWAHRPELLKVQPRTVH